MYNMSNEEALPTPGRQQSEMLCIQRMEEDRSFTKICQEIKGRNGQSGRELRDNPGKQWGAF